MSADTHPCAIAGCQVAILRGLLMCKRHWRGVPADLKAEVNDSYRALRRAASAGGGLENRQSYLFARNAAIAAVECREAAS